MKHAPEPAFRHDRPSRCAILLVNLGTPDAPTAPALRRYLGEFLADPRVVEIPSALWWPLLHGVILRVRPRKSAARYASIWRPEGSPLKLWTEQQAGLLAQQLATQGHAVPVRAAMRYGQPSVAAGLDALKAEGATRILVLPLYPQYAAATTASAFDAIAAWGGRQRNLPELRFVNRYADDEGYVGALAASIGEHWRSHGRPERLVLSFHGVPARTLALGDPYHCECRKTARLLAERLDLPAGQVLVTFQSRFGKTKWLEPYTEPTLVRLAREGIARVDVACPGFPADCLETLEEIDQEVRRAFLQAGGREFRYIPCLNDRADWIAALGAIALRHLQGWPTRQAQAADELRIRAERARALGAAG